MTAVFLSYYFPPQSAPRAVQVGRLAKHSRLPIRVLCASVADDPVRKGLEVLSFPDPSPRWWRLAKNFIYLPDPQRPWAERLARRAVRNGLINKEDVLVTFGQPMSDHLAGLYLKRRLGMPWVAHFSDPWSDNPYLLPLPFSRQRQRQMESQVFAAADRLLFTSAETVDLVMAKHPAVWRAKASVLPHAYDPALYGEPPPPPPSGPLLVRYLGNFYRQRNPLTLAKALALLLQTRPEVLDGVRIELIGRWVGHPNWTPSSLDLPETLLTMRKPVGYLESLRLMKEADALLIVDAPFEHNVFFPSKLVDYLGAGRPILAFTPPGTTADILATAGGEVASPASEETVAGGLSAALDKLRRGALNPPSTTVAEHYAAPGVAAAFDALVEDVLGITTLSSSCAA